MIPKIAGIWPQACFLRLRLHTAVLLYILLVYATQSFACEAADNLAAIKKIRSLGGSVHFQDADPKKPVVYVHLDGVSDNALVHLKALVRLKKLSLINSPISDGGAKAICECKQLETLYIDGSNITDDALGDIATLQHLTYLQLTGAKITGRGLTELTKLDHLQDLDLGENPIVSGSFKFLSKMKALWHLQIDLVEIEDSDLADISKCSELRSLVVGSPKITDQGIAYLKGLRSLYALYLNDINKTTITEGGLDFLQKALPKLGIAK